MANASKLAIVRAAPRTTRLRSTNGVALTPEIKNFIDSAVIPILVREFIEAEKKNTLAKDEHAAPNSPRKAASQFTRKARS
jgi:hypothetical protein